VLKTLVHLAWRVFLSQTKRLRLSYSSGTTLQSCPRKYLHYKVLGTSKDSDIVEDTTALRVGSAYHEILEDCLHEEKNINNLKVKQIFETNEIDDKAQRGLVLAMVRKYLQLHAASGLKIVACEIEIGCKDILGYVDFVALLPDGTSWVLGDLKTAGRVDMEALSARLSRDAQLNLYAAYSRQIAERLDLDPDAFAGVRYRVTTKSSVKIRGDETLEDFVSRLIGKIRAIDFEIPVSRLSIPATHQLFLDLAEQANGLKDLPLHKVPQNRSHCMSYFRPCSYWSQCHGSLFSEGTLTYSEV